MKPFSDYKREHNVDTIGGIDGQVGNLVLTHVEIFDTAKFELPALFIITETHGEPGQLKYTLCHQPSGEIVGPMKGDYLYNAHEFLKIETAYKAYVVQTLQRQLATQKGHIALLSSILSDRGPITVITHDELVKIKALIGKGT